jgi:Zn-dependent protease
MRDGTAVLIFFTVCMIHEVGHGIALYICGGRISRLIFCGMGIRMIPDRRYIPSVFREVVILLGGPFINILMSAVGYITGNYNFAVMNLCAAAFNLLPYSSLDGGAVIQAVMGDSAEIILTVMKIIILVAVIFAVAFYGRIMLPLLCVTVFYTLR